jgi:DmsE family decaheme c-type cytochrome
MSIGADMKNPNRIAYRLVALVALWPGFASSQEAVPAAAPAAAPPAAPAAVEYSKKGADTCLTCHDDAVTLAVFHGKHGQPGDPASPFGKGQLQCEACHGPGGEHTKRVKKGEKRPPVIRFSRDSTTPVKVQNGMCLGCHEKSMGSAWHIGPHEIANVSCAACHDSHARKDAVLTTSTQPDVCYTCHASQRSEFLKPFAHPVRQGQLACSDCHQPHGTTAEAQVKRATLNDTCFECHAEKRGPYLWEHAPVSENCANCHKPHGSNTPALLAARGPWLCQSCHSEQGHPSFAYGPQGLPNGGGGSTSTALVLGNCMNCHSQVHGSNHPSGSTFTR